MDRVAGRLVTWSCEFTLNELPPLQVGGSGAGSHWKRAKTVKRIKQAVWLEARRANAIPPAPFERVSLTITRLSCEEPDYDNLVVGSKAIVDGLVAAGFVEDDRPENFEGRRPEYRWEHAPRGEGRVRIEVAEV